MTGSGDKESGDKESGEKESGDKESGDKRAVAMDKRTVEVLGHHT